MENIWGKVDFETLEMIKAKKKELLKKYKKLFKICNIILVVILLLIIVIVGVSYMTGLIEGLINTIYSTLLILGSILSFYILMLAILLLSNTTIRDVIKDFFVKTDSYFIAEGEYLCTFVSTGKGLSLPLMHLCRLADGTYCSVRIMSEVDLNLKKVDMPISLKLYIKNKAPKLKGSGRVRIIACERSGKIQTMPAWSMIKI